jgi:hypothetical protein
MEACDSFQPIKTIDQKKMEKQLPSISPKWLWDKRNFAIAV